MKLIRLWEADLHKAFELYQQFDEDENGFMNEAYGISLEEFPTFVQRRKDNSLGINMRPGRAKSTDYILEDNGHYVGIFKLRHYLNDVLRNGAGHIGFGIAKQYRNKGYAANGLGMLIEIAKTIVPEDELYMACYKTNGPSLKTQMKYGAYIHHEDEKEFYTRIPIKNKQEEYSKVRLSFDRRTEMLSVLYWLSNYKIKFPFLVNLEKESLYSKAINYFKDSNYYHVVSLFETLVNEHDLSFDAPVALFLQFNEEMSSYHLEEYPYVSRLNKNPLVIELMNEVIVFYKESNFEEYYRSNFKYYNDILNKQTSLHLNTITSVMYNMYGQEMNNLNLSINITSGTTNGGYSITLGNHVICSSGLLDNNIYLYDSMVLHEFSHHFINPLTNIYLKKEDKHEQMLFADIKEDVVKQGYVTNETIINEYMIRAIECCYHEIYCNQELNTFIEKNKRHGFKDIEYIYCLMKKEVFDSKYLIKDAFPTILELFVYYLRNKKKV